MDTSYLIVLPESLKTPNLVIKKIEYTISHNFQPYQLTYFEQIFHENPLHYIFMVHKTSDGESEKYCVSLLIRVVQTTTITNVQKFDFNLHLFSFHAIHSDNKQVH